MTRTVEDLQDYFATLPTDLGAEDRLRNFTSDLVGHDATDLVGRDATDPSGARPRTAAEIRLVPADGTEHVEHQRRRGWLLPAIAASVLVAAVGATVILDRPGHTARPGTPQASAATPGATDLPAPLVPADPTPSDYPLSFAYVPQGWTATSWADGHVNLTQADGGAPLTVTLISGAQPQPVGLDDKRVHFLQIPSEPQRFTTSDGATPSPSPAHPELADEVQVGIVDSSSQPTVQFLINRPSNLAWSTEAITDLVDGITTRPGAVAEPAKSLGKGFTLGPATSPSR